MGAENFSKAASSGGGTSVLGACKGELLRLVGTCGPLATTQCWLQNKRRLWADWRESLLGRTAGRTVLDKQNVSREDSEAFCKQMNLL